MESATIGFIGLGIMGRPMALNLIKAGYRLQLYARRPQATQPLVDTGAKSFDSPQLAAVQASLVIIMVSDTADVEAVIFGQQGIIHGASPNTIIVDMGTSSPAATRSMAEQLEAKGLEMLDAPVSGGEQGAIDGKLSIMVGGKKTVFETALPVFQVLAECITYVGDHGAGQVAKACNQIVAAQTISAVAEALSLARASGVDPARVRDALLGGFAYSKVLEIHGQRMLELNFKPGFKARLHAKDMRIALTAAAETGISLPGATLALDHLERLIERGGAELDSSAIATLLEPQ
jgi:2-hydroxy-3-oxopropionate reductase